LSEQAVEFGLKKQPPVQLESRGSITDGPLKGKIVDNTCGR